MLTPGTSVEKVVKAFESAFGVARKQKVPCDSSIRLPDGSEKLNSKDCSSYRSIIRLCLYVSRERPDLMFTIKELASSMAAPTLTSVQRLRKLVGYMKHVGDLALRLGVPMPGQGIFFFRWRYNLDSGDLLRCRLVFKHGSSNIDLGWNALFEQ